MFLRFIYAAVYINSYLLLLSISSSLCNYITNYLYFHVLTDMLFSAFGYHEKSCRENLSTFLYAV